MTDNRFRRRSRLAALATFGAFVAASLMVGPAASADTGTGPVWLALGDSYSSGEGIPGTDPPGKGNYECARANGKTGARAWSVVAYDKVWAEQQRKSKHFFFACTGALADSTLQGKSDAAGQIEEAAPWVKKGEADVISFSFGGNDIGFADLIKDCIDIGKSGIEWGERPAPGCTPTEGELRALIGKLVGKRQTAEKYQGGKALPAVYDQIADHVRPGGHIFVLGYPQVVEELDKWPTINRDFWGECQRILARDVGMLRSVAGYLNEQIALAVADANSRHPNVTFHWLDVSAVYENSNGRHGLCSNEPWLNGVSLSVSKGDFRKERSFHPTQKGHIATGEALAVAIRYYGADKFIRPATSPAPSAPAPSKVAPNTSVLRPAPTTSSATSTSPCPGKLDGHWTGTWESTHGTGSGGVSANVSSAGSVLGGNASLSGDTSLQGGELSGSIACGQVTFGVVSPAPGDDNLVDFTGTVSRDGRTIRGTYVASVEFGDKKLPWDEGTYELKRS